MSLSTISPQLLQGISYLNAIIGFGKRLQEAVDYLSGCSDDKPQLDRVSYENISNIVEPVARDHGSQLNIGTVNANVFINIGSTEANAVQNSSRKEIDALKEPSSKLYEKVLMYWYQARADKDSKAGDRGIIEPIGTNPVKVMCLNDQIKLQMVFEQENPFQEAYVVDVMVETIRGKPALYKILALHDKFERED